MKSRPIIFSAPMIRAILDGRKSQTRRVVRDGPELHLRGRFVGLNLPGSSDGAAVFDDACGDDPVPVQVRCPFGVPGNQLWVKEAWALAPGVHTPHDWRDVIYRADAQVEMRWTSPIYMPRAASRITLEVTGVPVERLQSITEEDAIAEGLESNDDDGVTYYGQLNHGTSEPRSAYRELWESIHGPGSWELNPWVWAVSFRRVEP